MAKLGEPSTINIASPGASCKIEHPNPLELDIYLPWACGQLECEYMVSVTKIAQSEYVSVSGAKKSAKAKPKKIQSSSEIASEVKKDDKMVQSTFSDEEGTVKIFAIYDSSDQLVELKFEKNREIPRLIFQILGLIVRFQTNLNIITINQGIDMYSLYEINKFLPTCYVTDLCFDGTYLKEGNYSILLEQYNLIKRISLARCGINDVILETMASKLVYPLPASKTLVVLNLSTNRITDIGAGHLAHALRSNRCLSYLNLSDNRLSDIGAVLLFDSLTNFKLTDEELFTSKRRLMKYYIAKNALATQIVRELRVADQMRAKRKSVKPMVTKKGKSLEREGSIKTVSEMKSFTDMDGVLFERACGLAEAQMGRFDDPFTRDNLVTQDGVVYCLGNNTLCYLNLSYNNLTYIGLKKLASVVMTQKMNNRKPTGLINICIEGNNLPVSCIELMNIETVLNSGMADKSFGKKRPRSKSISSGR